VRRQLEYRIMNVEYRRAKGAAFGFRYFSPSFPLAEERVDERSAVRVSKLCAMLVGYNLIYFP